MVTWVLKKIFGSVIVATDEEIAEAIQALGLDKDHSNN